MISYPLHLLNIKNLEFYVVIFSSKKTKTKAPLLFEAALLFTLYLFYIVFYLSETDEVLFSALASDTRSSNEMVLAAISKVTLFVVSGFTSTMISFGS